jgi:hypothetical protein
MKDSTRAKLVGVKIMYEYITIISSMDGLQSSLAVWAKEGYRIINSFPCGLNMHLITVIMERAAK